MTHEDPLAALRRLPTPEARAGLHDQIKAQARGPLRRRRARRRVGRWYGDVELALAAAMALLYLGWAAQAVTRLHSLPRRLCCRCLCRDKWLSMRLMASFATT